MAHFAEIDENNIVTRVLVISDEQEHRGQEFLADELGLGGTWIQTSANCFGGIHYLDLINGNRTPSGKPHLRYNYAGVGCTYDPVRDAFIPPKPDTDDSSVWVLNEDTFQWDLLEE